LDDSHYPFNPFTEAGEGDFFTVFKILSYTNTLPARTPKVFKNTFILDSSAKTHKRAVYNFLFVLADFGGVQLILTIIVHYLTGYANDKKSMMSILKKFFYIKTSDPTFLKHPTYVF